MSPTMYHLLHSRLVTIVDHSSAICILILLFIWKHKHIIVDTTPEHKGMVFSVNYIASNLGITQWYSRWNDLSRVENPLFTRGRVLWVV